MPMIPKLAYRNLFHDRLSLVVTLVGIVFSVVLVAVQFGIYLGSENRIAAMLDQAKGGPVGGGARHQEFRRSLSALGPRAARGTVDARRRQRRGAGGRLRQLAQAEGWLDGSAAGRLRGHARQCAAVGRHARQRGCTGCAVRGSDRSTYFGELGIKKLGDRAEVNNMEVTVNAVTQGIRSFTTLPYVFTTLATARTLLGASPDQSSYTLVNVAPGASIETVRAALASRLPDAEILTHAEFRKRSLDYWLFETGAGAALIAGAALGIIVGIVIVAQTLYASTKDHLNEFATLRALGASAGYINKVILMQAVLSAIIGYLLGMVLSLVVIWASQDSTLLIVMTPGLAACCFALTVGMCVLAAMCAIFKVIRIDPAVVFSR
jgi:putative ABC transport system permease protein